MKHINENFNFVIIGGGTAGWLTALYINKYFPLTKITVVASDEIGILGAGEGATPQLVDMLNEIDISVTDLIVNASATIKNGIKFTNWTGDGSHYYHPFKDYEGLDHALFSDLNYANYPLMDLYALSKNGTLDEIDFSANCSEKNLVRFVPKNVIWEKHRDPIHHFSSLGLYSLHFNAVELAEFLKKTSINRGINFINSKIIKINSKENKNVESFDLDNGMTLCCDFVFDCTGFSRLIIGKHFLSKWISYKDYLPVKTAIPFFLPITEKIPPYTESIAMKYGWMWKIPTTKRFGCGYVFDSDYITVDDAKKEIINYLNMEIEFPRVFNFEPGCFEETWINNCIAIGLSSGFVEPLEATSIWLSILSLREFLQNIRGVTENNSNSKKTFNGKISYYNKKVLEFICFHYMSSRSDSEFWKNFKTKNLILDDLVKIDNLFQTDIPNIDFFTENKLFIHKSWYAVAAGLRKIDPAISSNIFTSYTQGIRSEYFNNFKSSYFKNLENNLLACIDHKKFLNYLINNY
jgi:tryptophan halogenase